MVKKPNPTEIIHISPTKQQLSLIRDAASLTGESVQEFTLRSVLANLQHTETFYLQAEEFSKLEKELSSEPRENPVLSKLLAEKAPWED